MVGPGLGDRIEIVGVAADTAGLAIVNRKIPRSTDAPIVPPAPQDRGWVDRIAILAISGPPTSDRSWRGCRGPRAGLREPSTASRRRAGPVRGAPSLSDGG